MGSIGFWTDNGGRDLRNPTPHQSMPTQHLKQKTNTDDTDDTLTITTQINPSLAGHGKCNVGLSNLSTPPSLGYYHYATGTNETYEETLPKVKVRMAGSAALNRCFDGCAVDMHLILQAYHDSLGVPFKHWQQLDQHIVQKRFEQPPKPPSGDLKGR